MSEWGKGERKGEEARAGMKEDGRGGAEETTEARRRDKGGHPARCRQAQDKKYEIENAAAQKKPVRQGRGPTTALCNHAFFIAQVRGRGVEDVESGGAGCVNTGMYTSLRGPRHEIQLDCSQW
jgi:hypothetical protein